VPLILAAIIVAKSPAQYGFEQTAAEALAYDKVALPRAVDLRRVAEWTGTTIDEIQSLNPELRRWTTPVKYPDYEVKIPLGTAGKLMSELSDADPSQLGALNWYTVRRGETLATVARKLRVSRVDLAEANHLTIQSRLRAGQELIIPRAPATLLAAHAERPAPVTVASRAIGGPASVATVKRAAETRGPLTYRVKRGDTLSSIARLFDTTVERLKRLNQIRGNLITVGSRLTVRAQ
jgi:membrane-bound lytic murein transglycosylase D